MVGKACGLTGVRPGTYCEPKMATVGSQDTTGAMTRDELKELACLRFFGRFGDAEFLSHSSVSQTR
jgi:aconitate hydratase 2 / 2-methylisocitrate dehydratase